MSYEKSITVDLGGGRPIPQPRQRHRVVVPKDRSAKPYVHNYTPANDPVNDYKRIIRLAFNGVPMIEAGLLMEIEFVFPRLQSMIHKKKPMLPDRHKKKPDLDNLAKSVLDCLSGLLYKDDSQIYSLKLFKRYHEEPGKSFVCIKWFSV